MLLSSISVNNNQLSKIKNRILELQEEVQEKNKWAFSLDEQIKSLETVLKETQEHNETKVSVLRKIVQ